MVLLDLVLFTYVHEKKKMKKKEEKEKIKKEMYIVTM